MSRRHSITVDITLIDHNAADIDAGTVLNALTFENIRIALRYATLDFHCAKHSIDGAREFNQQTITCSFDDTAAMLGNLWNQSPHRHTEVQDRSSSAGCALNEV